MPSTDLSFADRDAHRAWLAGQADLPRGFRVAVTQFGFTPVEAPKPSRMRLTLIAADTPSPAFAAAFTRNAFPGAPIIVGRERLSAPVLGAIVINNKISNVCAPGGVAASRRLAAETARRLGLAEDAVLPCSTGVIGWRLPVDDMVAGLDGLVAGLAGGSVLPAAEGICTTDLYPKVRSAILPGGARIVGIAKGAGMIEPNLATMLVYILTDAALPREQLRDELAAVLPSSFNAISIDGDQSTSDTVVLWSSCAAGPVEAGAFRNALQQVCSDLAEDVVRNGEGVRHVQRITVRGAPDAAVARAVGKALANALLWKCALAGNDPNVGRILQAVGDELGNQHPHLATGRVRIELAGRPIVVDGVFQLDRATETALIAAFRDAELYPLVAPADGLTFKPPVDFPRHERSVPVLVDLGLGSASATVFGNDLTHEYVTENADYRS